MSFSSFSHLLPCLPVTSILPSIFLSITCFSRQFLRKMWPTFSSFSRLLPCLPVTSILPSIFLSITCFSRQFLRKMRPIQLAWLFCIFCRIFLSSLTLYVLLHFSHDRSNWFSPSFSRTTFQNFPGISALPSEVSKFQRHTYCATKVALY
jgi:hypothetical protein